MEPTNGPNEIWRLSFGPKEATSNMYPFPHDAHHPARKNILKRGAVNHANLKMAKFVAP